MKKKTKEVKKIWTEPLMKKVFKPEVKIEPKVEIKKVEPIVQKVVSYITGDTKVVEKIQDKFPIKNISMDPEGKRTFEFIATEEEVKNYLKGVN